MRARKVGALLLAVLMTACASTSSPAMVQAIAMEPHGG